MAYFGGKTRLAHRIAELLPAHGHYVEPFAGSLAVLLAKEPSKMETVNDLDGLLMTFWRVLRDRPEELMRACALTPHSRADYLEARAADLDRLDDVEVARLVWLQIAQGRGGTMRQSGWRMFVNPNGSSMPMGDYLEAYVNRMAAAAQRLHRVSLECRPGLEVVEQYGSDPGCCLYVDPPYLGGVRRATGNGYRIEMREPASHVELLESLLRCRASIVVSGYESELYSEALVGWDRTEMAATSQGGTNVARTEVLWCNRPISQQLSLGDVS
ncbi:D12 class N6 adenine-specific DNA methyltransferase [Mycobacteroides abscessus subsp. abscessus]|nr:D12 class N6 adenine-specific DNA methyltransferase [Mycobacteroides abscessus subsp. abscessus]SKU58205.1 D12 class N6 adenine-specific DNA methyltransferase [Mycobacteroides abscessus subsp. abscessus]